MSLSVEGCKATYFQKNKQCGGNWFGFYKIEKLWKEKECEGMLP